MKKFLVFFICLTFVVASLAGCGSQTATKENTNADGTVSVEEKAEPVTLRLYQYLTMYTDQINEMTKEFSKFAPNITIEAELIEGANYWTGLKTKMASAETPDIFFTSGYNHNKVYNDYSLDLTNEPAMKNIDEEAVKSVTYDGKITAYPFIRMYYSLIYNKQLFAKAGITELPTTFTQLEEVCKKLEANKIIPFANGYKDFWTFKHVYSQFLGADGDPEAINKEIGSGAKKFSDYPYAMKMFDFVDLSIKYGMPKPLEASLNEDAVEAIVNEKAAMCHNGSWIADGAMKINPNAELGILPLPVGDDPDKARLMADVAMVYRLSKDGENVEAAKKWLDWMITSDYGKNFVGTKLKEMGTIKDGAIPDGQLAKEAKPLIEKGQTYMWGQNYWPDGFEQQFGNLIQAYIGKAKTKEQVVDEIQQTWTKLYQSENK